MNITKKFEQSQKKKAIGMLKALIKKIENGEFSLVNHGFWISGLDDKIQFHVSVFSRDSKEDSRNFNQYS